VESLLGLINPIEVRLRGSPIVSIRAQELLALNCLWLGKSPLTLVAGAVTDNQTKVMGLELPLWLPKLPWGAITYRFVYNAVSGVDTETLTVAEIYSDKVLKDKYLHAVELPGTTLATTGFGTRMNINVIGDLIGILFYSTTIPTVTSEVATIQDVDIYLDGVKEISRSWQELHAEAASGMQAAVFGSPGDRSLIDNYAWLDLSRDPIPKATPCEVDINAGVANEAFRITPVFLIPH